MVRSMISQWTLLECLSGKALKTTTYILNRVSSKAIVKTPFELWTKKWLSLKYLRVCECLAESRPYKPHKRKLDSKTLPSYFIGYP